MKFVYTAIFIVFALLLIAVCLWPQLDLLATGLFFKRGVGFPLEQNKLFNIMHHTAIRGAWALGFLFAACIPVAYFLRNGLLGVRSKGWLFLLLALLLGPVLIANGALKDHWGRARPREVTEFGGKAAFTPAWMPRADATRNGSFVSGDGAFGFFLPACAYLVPLGTWRKQSRRLFWGCMAVGGAFAFSRLAMGAHFLSDNLFAALFMLGLTAALHSAMYGTRSTRDYWRAWTYRED